MARSAYSSSMYHPIREAMTYVDKKVNLAAIVLDLGFPRPSRGTDYCCSLRIVDPSYSKAGGLSVNIFDVSTHLLPHVVACGDVLLLRDVWIKPYKQEVNAVFKKNISSFALYNGEISNDFVPYQISRFEPRDTDKMIVNTLRMWLVNFKPVEDSGKFLMFREIKEGNFFVDLACKILHCHEIANNRWMVFSWDGTDLPPNNINSNLEVEVDNPLPLHIEPESLPKELLCNFPKVGSILSLTWDTDIQKNHLKSLLDGKWVKIINVSLEVRAGLWHGILSPNTKLRYTPKDDTLIQERERFCGERISSNCKRLPFSSLPWTSCVTVVDHEDDPFFTLRNVLTHSQVIGKFKCVVRVVASSPCSAENFRTNEGKYMMRLTLEDPTARIHACVYDKDGETLFGGYPENTILMQKMDRLLGVMPPSNCGTEPNRIIRNPPWVIVYILAYYTNQDDKWGSRQFRVSATKIM